MALGATRADFGPDLFLDGVRPGMTYAQVCQRLKRPLFWTLNQGYISFNYRQGRVVWFDHGRVSAVFGHRLTSKENMIVELGEPVSDVEQRLGIAEPAHEPAQPLRSWASGSIGVWGWGDIPTVERLVLRVPYRELAFADACPWQDDFSESTSIDGVALGMQRASVQSLLGPRTVGARRTFVSYSRDGYVIGVKGRHLTHEMSLRTEILNRRHLSVGAPPAAEWNLPREGCLSEPGLALTALTKSGKVKTVELKISDPELLDVL